MAPDRLESCYGSWITGRKESLTPALGRVMLTTPNLDLQVDAIEERPTQPRKKSAHLIIATATPHPGIAPTRTSMDSLPPNGCNEPPAAATGHTA
jgi:hypothetical protein